MSDSDIDKQNLSIYELFLNSASQFGDCAAINYYGNKITYDDLLEDIDECAVSLHALNVSRGDHIAVILPNIPQAVILFYAANRIGAICDMIHPQSAERELEYYIKLSEARIVFAFDGLASEIGFIAQFVEKVFLISVSDYLPTLARIGFKFREKPKDRLPDGFESYQDFLDYGDDDASDEVKAMEYAPAELPCAVLYTGGTTGKAKGVMLTSRNFNSNAMAAIESCGCLEPGDKLLSILPVFHGFGLGVGVHTVMMFGGTSILLPTFKIKSFGKLVSKYKPEILVGVPAIYGAMVANEKSNGDMSFVKLVISGGDRLTSELMHSFNDLLAKHGSKTNIRQGYGLTESLSGVCLVPDGCLKENCIGVAYSNTQFKIVNSETGEELPRGESGEIIISGPSVMPGYLNEPEESDVVLKTDDDGEIWLYTGDFGHIDEEGFVYFESRIKRMIITNGYNIYPSAIEDIINTNSSVLECAVVGKPDKLRGEIARAFIVFDYDVIEKGEEEEALKDIKSDLALSVAKYSLPKNYKVIDSLPRTDIGKIDYRALQELGRS